MTPPSNAKPTTRWNTTLRKALTGSGVALATLAAISSILALLFQAGILHTPPPPPTPTPSIGDFTGAWIGLETPTSIHPSPSLVQLILARERTTSGEVMRIQIYAGQSDGQFTSTPQETASGIVSGGQVTLYATPTSEGISFAFDNWVLSLPGPKKMHFERYTHFQVSDIRADTKSSGDLCPLGGGCLG